MTNVKKLLLLVLCLSLSGIAQAASTRYVTDKFEINLRTGKGTQYQIVDMPSSGTPLEVLEVDEETGYSHVRTPRGREGYVLTRYLQDQPAARARLAAAERRLETLSQETAQLREQRDELRKANAEQAAALEQLRSESGRTGQELARLKTIAARPVELNQENQTLRERTVTLEKDLQMVRQENQILKDGSARDWFIAGAGVLIFGMLLGFVLPKLRGRQKSTW